MPANAPGSRTQNPLFALSGCLLLFACTSTRIPAGHSPSPRQAVPTARRAASTTSTPCDTCVHWDIAEARKVSGRSFRFSDGSTVTVDMHGVRYLTSKKAPFQASKYLLKEGPEEAIELADHTIAWLHENGESTLTATPLGPPTAFFPSPALAQGEQIATLYTSKHAFFVIGNHGTFRRSSDGGKTWDAIPLGLPAYARFVAIGNKDMLGADDEESYQANQRKGEGFLALWYHPMQYLESSDEGQTWHHAHPGNWVTPPEPSSVSLPDVPAGHEDDDDDDDRSAPRLDVGTFVAGGSLLLGRFVPGQGIDIETRLMNSSAQHSFLALPQATAADLQLSTGSDGAVTPTLWVKTSSRSQRFIFHRDDREATFVPLPSNPTIEALANISVFAGRGLTLLTGMETESGSRQLWAWDGGQTPQKIENPRRDLWLLDSVHRTLWGEESGGELWYGQIDFAKGAVSATRVPDWLGSLRRTRRDGTLDTDQVRTSSFSVDTDGTFQCIVQVAPEYLPHLVRVRANGTTLPILKLPFAQRPVNFDQRAVGFWGDRGYSSAGWETADGGEHWTRVDAWPLARNVQCIEDGCLVDQARRVDWVLPAGWRQGEPAVALEKPRPSPSKPDANLLFECQLQSDGQTLPAPTAIHSWKTCVPASVGLARWGYIAAGEKGEAILTVGLASGENRQLPMLTPKEPSAEWATTIGCDELGAFAATDPHQRQRETEKAKSQTRREPCASVAYYRWKDGVVRHAELSCKETQPWEATGPSVALTEKGLLLGNHRLERENERPLPHPWVLVSDDGKRSLINEPPSSQVVNSALHDGRDLWVFSSQRYGFPGGFSSVLAHFDGKMWEEKYLSLSRLSSLQKLEGRPVLTTFDLSGTVMAGEEPPSGEPTTLAPLGYFPLPSKGKDLPMLQPWRPIPAAELRPCGPEAEDRPFGWSRPGLPAVVRLRGQDVDDLLGATAIRVRFLRDGSSCTDTIVAGSAPFGPGRPFEPFGASGVLISPGDPEHSWLVVKVLDRFAYSPASCTAVRH